MATILGHDIIGQFSPLEPPTVFWTDQSFRYHGYQDNGCLGDKMVQEDRQITDIWLPLWIQAKVHEVRGRGSQLLKVGHQPPKCLSHLRRIKQTNRKLSQQQGLRSWITQPYLIYYIQEFVFQANILFTKNSEKFKSCQKVFYSWGVD